MNATIEEPNVKTQHGDLLRFNGKFTVESPSGEHRTFQIRTWDNAVHDPKPRRVISMLTGPENTADFTAFGYVVEDPQGYAIIVWKKMRGADNHRGAFFCDRYTHDETRSAFQTMAATICDLSKGDASKLRANGFRVLASTTCRRCNRDLTTPESIESGIGPVCAEKE